MRPQSRRPLRFDGTLALSEDIHRRAFSEVLGFELTVDHWEQNCVGSNPTTLIDRHLPQSPRTLGPDESAATLLEEKDAIFEAHVERDDLEELPGAARWCIGCARAACASPSSLPAALH